MSDSGYYGLVKMNIDSHSKLHITSCTAHHRSIRRFKACRGFFLSRSFIFLPLGYIYIYIYIIFIYLFIYLFYFFEMGGGSILTNIAPLHLHKVQTHISSFSTYRRVFPVNVEAVDCTRFCQQLNWFFICAL